MAVLPLNTQMSTVQLNVFKQTIRDFAQSLPDEYRRSRLDAHRYTHANTTLANFIELALEHTMEPEDFRALLCKVPGVTAVELHKCSKHDQGNPNAQDPKARTRRKGHYQAQNFMVYSTIFPGIGMEFELTESKLSKDKKKPLTISACYKTQPNRFRALEAWRILRTAVAGKELDSRIVAKVDFELRQLAGATGLTDQGLRSMRCQVLPTSMTTTQALTTGFQHLARRRMWCQALPGNGWTKALWIGWLTMRLIIPDLE